MPGFLMDINLGMRDHHHLASWRGLGGGRFVREIPASRRLLSCLRGFSDDCLVARRATAYSIARHALIWCTVEG